MLHGVPLQVPVQAEAGPAVPSDPLQLGQLGQFRGRRSLPVAPGDAAVYRGHALTGRMVGAGGLETFQNELDVLSLRDG